MTTNVISKSIHSTSARTMGVKALVPFLAITFGLTWGLAALLILFMDQILVIFGEISPTNPSLFSPCTPRELLAS